MNEPVKRGGCLTAWLILMILGSAYLAVTYLAMGDKLLPNLPGWSLPALGVLCIVNLLCAIAIFAWKKIGFYGVIGTTVITVVINIASGLPIASAAGGIIGILILYALLRPVWDNLS